MKLKRKQIINGIILLGAILLLFTPIGFRVKVKMSKLLAGSAAKIKEEFQVPLDTYQWDLADVKGKPFNFEDQKGNVVLVNFWATWCPPCVAEMPSLQELYNDYGDRMTFMLVAEDKMEKVESFLTKEKYGFPVYFSINPAPELLNAKVLPTTYIIDRSGRIVVAETGVANWNSAETRAMLDGLINEK